jgi:hypothetical protein
MNHYTSTIELYSQATGMKMGEFELTVGYDYFPAIRATQLQPTDPIEINIVSTKVKTTGGEDIGAAFLEVFLPDDFWQRLTQEIIDSIDSEV